MREAFIMPILQKLGYVDHGVGEYRIHRSIKLSDNWVRLGSRDIEINPIFPDYVLSYNGKKHFLIEAKRPSVNIHEGNAIHQAFYYAIHPEIKCDFFALCNGYFFNIFNLQRECIAAINLKEIDKKWGILQEYLNKKGEPIAPKIEHERNYLLRSPPTANITTNKQSVKRHFGVHPYFTRQVWNVVRDYIEHLSDKGDVVLDPFGGSGVTAIEAAMTDRKAIHVDLNPLSCFIVEGLISLVNPNELQVEIDRIVKNFPNQLEKLLSQSDSEIDQELMEYYPVDNDLPDGSDAPTLLGLFSRRQLIELALLKKLVYASRKKPIRQSLLVAFSSTINKINLTFHRNDRRSEGGGPGGGGDSGVMRYYRYRIAPEPTILDTLTVFKQKANRLRQAKIDVQTKINQTTIKDFIVIKGDAANLHMIEDQSVDYIYTDPPYGKKIPYLDLSVMWTSWLDMSISEQDFDREAIEGGSRDKGKSDYGDLIIGSIKEMYRVLKWNRWMSFVFQHQDPYYWHLIVENAEKIGFEYAGTVHQNNGQSSFKKRQNPFRVLSGQLIINFKKIHNPILRSKFPVGKELTPVLLNHIEAIIAKYNGATSEQITAELITYAMDSGYLDVLYKEYSDLPKLIEANYAFDEISQKYHLKPNTKFKVHIPVESRVRYFVYNYLNRCERERIYPTYDEIVFHVLPLLKNGVTPETQTITEVLNRVAYQFGKEQWRLKTDQFNLSV
ncbi:MAG: DNA methyltransferase [Candidatus Symbiobacter sp.]|nr:DNA methyltransferase [Candidatus Symbiobacter sp.]